MAHTDSLPQEVIEEVSRQLGTNVPRAVGRAWKEGSRAEVAESFAVWMLGLDAVTAPDASLNSAALQTGYWHHQIRIDGQSIAFARTQPLGPHAVDWKVTDVFVSDLAGLIDGAIDWVDQSVSGDPLIRLLLIPGFLMTALWVVQSEGAQLLIVDAGGQPDSVPTNTLLEEPEFFSLLRSLPHVIGRIRDR